MDYTKTKEEILAYIEANFSEKRKVHTEGVVRTALELSEIYGADPRKAEIAALFHDMYRGVRTVNLNYYVRQLDLDKRYLDNANLAHGKIAAFVMKRDFNIDDPEILNAVSYHTTGRKNMSLLEKVIYLADAIEPNRDYPGVAELRELALIDLNRACLKSMENTINFVSLQGKYLDPDTREAADYLRETL